MRTKRIIQAGPLILLLLGAVFVWGFLVQRNRIFPYTIVQAAKSRLAPEPGRPSRELVESRSITGDLERLEALGYLETTFDPNHERSGVLLHDEMAAWAGLNLYCSRTESRAQLVDMKGHQVHVWSYPGPAWQHVELLPGGGLLAIVKDKALLRLDRDSNLLWSYAARAHHDLWIDGDRLLLLTRRIRVEPATHPQRKIVEDSVTILDDNGVQLESISILETLRRSPYAFLLPAIQPDEYARDGPPLDLLHTNHVEVLDGRLAHISSIYARGNLLLSCRNINAVLILDGATREVVWLWGPSNLTFQHHPSMLENGHILIFDNGRQSSRIVEIDPLTLRIVWRFQEDGFFSVSRGSAQRLGNGNTLITESDPGYAFEVTPGGETVWLFANPDISESKERSAIWRMWRIDAERFDLEVK